MRSLLALLLLLAPTAQAAEETWELPQDRGNAVLYGTLKPSELPEVGQYKVLSIEGRYPTAAELEQFLSGEYDGITWEARYDERQLRELLVAIEAAGHVVTLGACVDPVDCAENIEERCPEDPRGTVKELTYKKGSCSGLCKTKHGIVELIEVCASVD